MRVRVVTPGTDSRASPTATLGSFGQIKHLLGAGGRCAGSGLSFAGLRGRSYARYLAPWVAVRQSTCLMVFSHASKTLRMHRRVTAANTFVRAHVISVCHSPLLITADLHWGSLANISKACRTNSAHLGTAAHFCHAVLDTCSC